MTQPQEDHLYRPSQNIYYAKLMALTEGAFTDKQTEAHKGKWRDKFALKSLHKPELHVELGCNGGHVTLEWSQDHPEHLYIGIDWKFKQVYKAYEKAKKRGLKNLLFFRALSERIDQMFADGEIDYLYLYFPDPWPKKAHLKNRTVTGDWLRQCAKVVRSGGVFHIKTDHAGYADWMRAAIAEVGDLWTVTENESDLYRSHPEPTKLRIPQVTLFERLFIKDKIPIHSMKLVRK
ncbi:MAG: tRNA (guanosine(46)-N7)-methyltransferase TrmB [Xanthomonadaceae bacterium]|nr:tRNA (guanosine(46)-N7)-methyltransferase TrmB [Xanthomonadaceae bacterium]